MARLVLCAMAVSLVSVSAAAQAADQKASPWHADSPRPWSRLWRGGGAGRGGMLANVEMARLIGLLGGSFNPAHRAHRAMSLAAMEALGLDEVWWLVSPGNPLKDKAGDMAPYAARLASAKAMARRSRIKVSDFELQSGTRYTVDTLRLIIQRWPRHRFIWLMGEDTVAQFHQWRRWRALARMAPRRQSHTPCSMRRSGGFAG